MSNVRKAKLEALLHAILAQYVNEEREGWGIGELVTVDQVWLADDLKTGQAWVSFIPQTSELAKRNFELLERHLSEIQGHIFRQMSIKRVPKLTLKLADPEETFRMTQIFDSIRGHEPNRSDNQTDAADEPEDSAGGA